MCFIKHLFSGTYQNIFPADDCFSKQLLFSVLIAVFRLLSLSHFLIIKYSVSLITDETRAQQCQR